MTTLGATLARCPDCPIGRQARELVLADGFWWNAGAALLPFLVVALVVRWVWKHL